MTRVWMGEAAEALPGLIRQGFAAEEPDFPGLGGPGSAVLLPLIEREGEWFLLFEKRAGSLRNQPGEICFPGGRIDGEEKPERTAVREACEELLVHENQISILAALDAVMGPTGGPVWPFVALLSDYEDSWSEDEVDHTFLLPLAYFLEEEPARYEAELVTLLPEDFPYHLIPGGRDYPWGKKKNPIYLYETEKGVIWGMTARISFCFADQLRSLLCRPLGS